ncbi:MAG: hypothetical protein DRG59_11860 [Deltaproteobacteria bacterium]|nr:MAG: hypothetical protein DRG83_08105 [Deltaproteobacteria bacterium]RLB03288.1 MAG: hypothetical protein DRG59_11860 [Deltaproteobacteria bacterium]
MTPTDQPTSKISDVFKFLLQRHLQGLLYFYGCFPARRADELVPWERDFLHSQGFKVKAL